MTTYTDLFTSYIVNTARQSLEQVRQKPRQRSRARPVPRPGICSTTRWAWWQDPGPVRELLLALRPPVWRWLAIGTNGFLFYRPGWKTSGLHQDWGNRKPALSLDWAAFASGNRYPEAEGWLHTASAALKSRATPHSVAAV